MIPPPPVRALRTLAVAVLAAALTLPAAAALATSGPEPVAAPQPPAPPAGPAGAAPTQTQSAARQRAAQRRARARPRLVGALRREAVRLQRSAERRAPRLALAAPSPLRLAHRPGVLRRQIQRLRQVHRRMTRQGAGAGWAVASAYSGWDAGTTQGCPGAPALQDSHLSVATPLVGCGRRLRICYRQRCVTAVRRDSGPYVGGRDLDLNIGVIRRLGFDSLFAWGVRTVRWRAL